MSLIREEEQFAAAISIVAGLMATRTDAAGDPLVLHTLRIAVKQANPVCRVVAALHDIVTGKFTDLPDLRRVFNPEVVDAVSALTQGEGEVWTQYLERVASNPYALPVKLAELYDDMDMLSRVGVMANDQIDHLERCKIGVKRLTRPAVEPEPLVQIQLTPKVPN